MDDDTRKRKQILNDLKNAPVDELRKIAISAGIYNADGTLTDFYKPAPKKAKKPEPGHNFEVSLKRTQEGFCSFVIHARNEDQVLVYLNEITESLELEDLTGEIGWDVERGGQIKVESIAKLPRNRVPYIDLLSEEKK